VPQPSPSELTPAVMGTPAVRTESRRVRPAQGRWVRISGWTVERVAALVESGATVRAFIAAVFLCWIALAAGSVRSLSGREALELLPIVVASALAQRQALGLYASNASISLGMAGSLAAGMLFGAPGAVVTTSAGVIASIGDRPKLRALLFNLGAVSLANAGATAAYLALSGLAPAIQPVAQLTGAMAAACVAYLCQSMLVTLIIALTSHRSPRAVWTENFRWLLPHWMVMGLVALGFAVTYRVAGIVGLLAFSGPVLLMRYSMKQYVSRTERSVCELNARNTELATANREIAAMSEALSQAYTGTLEALVAALDARDRETYGHSTRVAQLTMVLAKELGVQEGTQQWTDIERGALLHDVGKIGVADAILRKPGSLTDEEWTEMRGHARIGYEVLKDVPFLAGAAEIVAAHHERWDGHGYPRGLAGEQIPFGARIFALADTFDAMATDRPYRRARPYHECLAEIARCAGTQFDPAAVKALYRVYPQWVELHRNSIARAAVGDLRMVA
jgi:putative nucleotidyltransferase with HDIG domain